jgi:hypothetical protein
MTSIFDIFATLPNGRPLWIGAVEGLDEARNRLRELAESRPGEYFIYSEQTCGVIERTGEHLGPFAEQPVHSSRKSHT